MSFSCLYEVDSDFWAEFGANSDRKKRRYDVMGSKINNTDRDVYLSEIGTMLERSPWPGAINGGSPAPGDTGLGKDLQKLTSENSKMSNSCFNSGHVDVTVNEFCTATPLLADNSNTGRGALYNYSFNQIPQTENSLSFFDNGCNDEENGDLFFGWSDIGNFEDVDKMLRSCDSTFGLESPNNEGDMWLSSSQPREECEAAMTDNSKPNSKLENCGASLLKNENFLTNGGSNHMAKDDHRSAVDGNSALGKVLADASKTSSQKKGVSVLDEQANLKKNLAKHLNHLDGKRNRYSENGIMSSQSDNSRQVIDPNHMYENSTCQYYPPPVFQQPGVTCSHSSYDQPSDQISVSQSKFGVRPESNSNPSSASNESFASNQTSFLESLHGPPFDTPSMNVFEERGNLWQGRDMHPSVAVNVRNGNTANMMLFSESAPVHKNGHENEDINDAAKLDSSNVQESSCVSSVMDGISMETTSFRQLQRAIEQLDVRTKLSIRDSLYRLAKSAEHRHNCMNSEGGNRLENVCASHLVTCGSEKYAGFMDIETDTNPIDRSIAHLLFHRPSDSSLVSENNVLSYKSHPTNPQSNSSPSLRIENREETPIAGGTETEGE